MRLVWIATLLSMSASALASSPAEKRVRRAVDRAIQRMEEEPGAASHVRRVRRAVDRALRSGEVTQVQGPIHRRLGIVERPAGGAAALIEAVSPRWKGGAAWVDVIVPEAGGSTTTTRVHLHPRDGFTSEESNTETTRVPLRDP